MKGLAAAAAAAATQRGRRRKGGGVAEGPGRTLSKAAEAWSRRRTEKAWRKWAAALEGAGLAGPGWQCL